MLLIVSGRVVLFLFFFACMFDERETEQCFFLPLYTFPGLSGVSLHCTVHATNEAQILFYVFSSPQTILQLATLTFYGRKAVSPQLHLLQTFLCWHFLDCNLKLHVSLNTVLLLIQDTHFSTIQQKKHL